MPHYFFSRGGAKFAPLPPMGGTEGGSPCELGLTTNTFSIARKLNKSMPCSKSSKHDDLK